MQKSPTPLRGRQGCKRGRRSIAEALCIRSPRQKSIASFISVASGVKRPLIEEIDASLNNTFAQPSERILVTDAKVNNTRPVNTCVLSDSVEREESVLSEVRASFIVDHSTATVDSLDNTQFYIPPSVVTSSPVKMGTEDSADVKSLFNNLLSRFTNMESGIMEVISKQNAESDKKLDALKQLVSSLDVNFNAKGEGGERRVQKRERIKNCLQERF